MLTITCVTSLLLLLADVAPPPRPTGDEIVDYVAWLNETYAVPPAENAAELYLEAVDAYVYPRSLHQKTDKRTPYHADKVKALQATIEKRDLRGLSADDSALLSAYLTANKAAFAKFAAGAERPRCYFECKPPESGSMTMVVLPHLHAMLELARGGGAAEARLKLLRGQPIDAADSAVQILRFSHHLRQQPFAIYQFIGGRPRDLAYDLAEDIAAASDDADFVDKFIKLFRKEDERCRPPLHSVTIERASHYDTAQRYLTDTDGDGRLDTQGMAAALSMADKSADGPLAEPGTLPQILERIDARFDTWLRAFKADYATAMKICDRVEREIEQDKQGGGSIFGLGGGASPRRLIRNHHEMVARQRACYILLFVREYQLKHGQWPEKLSDVLRGNRRALNRDPFTGDPFRYELKDGEPLLYSVGWNMTDDGGERFVDKHDNVTWGETGDHVFWPRR